MKKEFKIFWIFYIILIIPVICQALTNSLGMTFVSIPAGTFMIGSPENEPGRASDETQHQVTLTQGYYMQTTEVTQGQWEAVMGSNPSSFSSCGSNCPVENVSWDDVQGFIDELNQLGEGTYSLPTEAQWEYAARAGSTTTFANGAITEYEDMYVWACNTDVNLDAMGWYCDNSDSTTHPVAQKTPNAWGLYDMHGNVYEWCQDWAESYTSESVTDPAGPTSGSYRVFRGGSWYYPARFCRSADRAWTTPDYSFIGIGLRLVLLSGDSDTCEDYDDGYEDGKQYCINNPSACGIDTNGGTSDSITINSDLSFSFDGTYSSPFGEDMDLSVDFTFFDDQNGTLLWKLENVTVQ